MSYRYVNGEGDEMEVLTECECPACGGLGYELGALGRLVWFRCRACGIDFNKEEG